MYLLENGKDNLNDLDDRPDDPDIDDGDESEYDGPKKGQGEHEESGEESVEPELGVAEQDERQAPQGIKPVS